MDGNKNKYNKNGRNNCKTGDIVMHKVTLENWTNNK